MRSDSSRMHAFPVAVRSGSYSSEGERVPRDATISKVNLFSSAGVCLEFSTRHLKFPTRAAYGSSPTPVRNEIYLVFSQPDVVFPGSAQCTLVNPGVWWTNPVCVPYLYNPPLHLYDDWNMTAVVGNLTIKAMAPVILITGCCGEGADFWHNLSPSDMAGRFTQLKVPYDDRFLLTNSGVLTGDADGQSSQTVADQTSLIAGTFGSQWVNWVGHSKGGLWARAAFSHLSNIGVLSLTTLDTPHEGSFGGDLAEQYRKGARFPDVPMAAWLALWNRVHSDEPYHTTEDLTVAAARAFNGRHPSPPASTKVNGVEKPLRAYALSSDANLDGSTDPRKAKVRSRSERPSACRTRLPFTNSPMYLKTCTR